MDRSVKFDLPAYCLVKSLVYDWISSHCDRCDKSKCSKGCFVDVLNRAVSSLENAEKVDLKNRVVDDGDSSL